MTNISKLSEQELQALSMRLQTVKQEAAQLAKLEDYRPYPKQELFHLLGSKYRERLFSAGNQLGKTYSGASEIAYHLTGRYPPWWKGRRWSRPTSWLAGSVTGDVTRDGMQRLLMGPPAIEEMWGTGLLPRDTIAQKPKRRAGIKDAMDAVVVNHAQGGQSVVQFKSFDQGRAKWQANTVDGVWMDEEPPFDVYEEAVTRTNATEGMVFITFTPLLGMSQVVMRFFNNPGIDRVVVQMGIEDVGPLYAGTQSPDYCVL